MAAMELKYIVIVTTMVIFIENHVCTKVIAPNDWNHITRTEDNAGKEEHYPNIPSGPGKKIHRNKRMFGSSYSMFPKGNMNSYMSNRRPAYHQNTYNKGPSSFGQTFVKQLPAKSSFNPFGAPSALLKPNSQTTKESNYRAGDAPKSSYNAEQNQDILIPIKPKSGFQSNTIEDEQTPLLKPNSQNTKGSFGPPMSMDDFQQKLNRWLQIKPTVSAQSDIQSNTVKGEPPSILNSNSHATKDSNYRDLDTPKTVNDVELELDRLSQVKPKISTQSDIQSNTIKGAPPLLLKPNSQNTKDSFYPTGVQPKYDFKQKLDLTSQIKPTISTQSDIQSNIVKDEPSIFLKPNNQATKDSIYGAGDAPKPMYEFKPKLDFMSPIKPKMSTQNDIQSNTVKGQPSSLLNPNSQLTLRVGDAPKSVNDVGLELDRLSQIKPKFSTHRGDIQSNTFKGVPPPLDVFKPNSQPTMDSNNLAGDSPESTYDIDQKPDRLIQLKLEPSTQSVIQNTKVVDTESKDDLFNVITYRTKRGMGYRSYIPQTNMNKYMSNQLNAYQLNAIKKDYSRYGKHFVKKPTIKPSVGNPFGAPPKLEGLFQRYKHVTVSTPSSIKRLGGGGGGPMYMNNIEAQLDRLKQINPKPSTRVLQTVTQVPVIQRATLKVNCSSHPCKNGGSCLSEGVENFICACANDYNGAFCEEPMSKCNVMGCDSISSCVSYPSEAVCLCDDKDGKFCRMSHGEPTQEEKLKALVSHEGNGMLAVVVVMALLSLCTCLHCCRVCSKRGQLRETYRQWLKSGIVPDDLPPDFMTISSSLCFCRAGELDKKVEAQVQAPIEKEEKSKKKKKKKKKKKSKKSKDNESSKEKESKSKDLEEDNQSFNCYRRKPKTYSTPTYYDSDDEHTNAKLLWDYHTNRNSNRTKIKPRYRGLPRNQILSPHKDITETIPNTKPITGRFRNNSKPVRFHTDYIRQVPSLRRNYRTNPRRRYYKNITQEHPGFNKAFSDQDYKTRAYDQHFYESELESRSNSFRDVKTRHYDRNDNSVVVKPNQIVPETDIRFSNQKPSTKHQYDPVAVMNLVWSDRTNTESGRQESDTDASSEETIYEQRHM